MNVDQGGIGLPERDYYLKDDPKNVETREKYVAHMTRMFTLAGDSAEQAAAARAKSVLALETRLAAAQLDRVARRDPNNRDHPMTLDAISRASRRGSTSPPTSRAAEAPAFTRRQRGLARLLQGARRDVARDVARRSEELRTLARAERQPHPALPRRSSRRTSTSSAVTCAASRSSRRAGRPASAPWTTAWARRSDSCTCGRRSAARARRA